MVTRAESLTLTRLRYFSNGRGTYVVGVTCHVRRHSHMSQVGDLAPDLVCPAGQELDFNVLETKKISFRRCWYPLLPRPYP